MHCDYDPMGYVGTLKLTNDREAIMFRKLFSTLLVTLLFTSVCHGGLLYSDYGIWGATDVNIDNHLYNIEFLDGRCTHNFTGCDEPSDFAFNTREKSIAASWALIDVLGDEWIDFGLVGCGVYCTILTPYDTGIYSTDPRRVVDFSYVTLQGDTSGVGENSLYADYGISITEGMVWGLWTHQRYIPEPGSLMLLLLGLVGLSLFQRGKKCPQAQN